MESETSQPKPRMLLFRWNKAGIPPFISSHLDAQLRALRHYFEVRLVDYDCDYGRICDEFEPAVSVFESGVYSGGRRIVNTSARPDVPKLGFLHADAYDLARAVFLSDMEQWGVEEFFTTSVVMAEYTPEIADRLFVWPNAIDPHVFRDYGLRKNIPVLFTGSHERHYPWRNAMNQILTPQYITMSMPHFGWGRGTGRTVFGAEYARLLNASFFVPSCGSMAKDVVRKLLEIPASMACLVTEPTPHLKTFGFEDMVNCVLADAGNVEDKLDFLWRDPERLRLITKAGHDLVHANHAEANRNQVFQWLQLKAAQKTGETIQQESPCGPLTLTQGRPQVRIVPGPGKDRTYLAEGWRLLRRDDPDSAQREFLKCLNYYFIPEAVTGMAFANLAKGDASAALTWVDRAITESMGERGATDPDPVLWASRIRALLCLGESAAAISAARRFGHLRSTELDRVRTVVSQLFPDATDLRVFGEGKTRPSVTPLPPLDDESWTIEFYKMLARSGQRRHMAVLSGASPQTRSDQLEAPPLARLVGRRITRMLQLRLTSGRGLRIRIALSPYKQRLIGDKWSRLIGAELRRAELARVVVIGKARSKDVRSMRNAVGQSAWLPELREVASFSEATRRGLFSTGARDRVAVYLSPHLQVPDNEELSGLEASCLVVIDGTASSNGFALLENLLRGETFHFIAQEPEHGRAILRRQAEPNVITAKTGTTTRKASDGTIDQTTMKAERAS